MHNAALRKREFCVKNVSQYSILNRPNKQPNPILNLKTVFFFVKTDPTSP